MIKAADVQMQAVEKDFAVIPSYVALRTISTKQTFEGLILGLLNSSVGSFHVK